TAPGSEPPRKSPVDERLLGWGQGDTGIFQHQALEEDTFLFREAGRSTQGADLIHFCESRRASDPRWRGASTCSILLRPARLARNRAWSASARRASRVLYWGLASTRPKLQLQRITWAPWGISSA